MRRATLHRLFRLSLLLKGLDGLLELVGGLLLLAIGNGSLTRILTALTAPELAEDPHDLIANAILHAVSHLSANTRLFVAAYLFGHGAVKVFFVAGLWRAKLWAFPTALVIMGAFIVYQVYRFTQRPSLVLVALTILDLCVVAVIWREYQVRKRSPAASQGYLDSNAR